MSEHDHQGSDRALGSGGNRTDAPDANNDTPHETTITGMPPPEPHNQNASNMPSAEKYKLYCQEMGIKKLSNGELHPIPGLFYSQRKDSFYWAEIQYWCFSVGINLLFILQVGGAAVSAILSASGIQNSATVISAINTVTGGLLAFLKSRAQPNRARQQRNELRKVVEAIENFEMEFQDPNTGRTVEEAIDFVRQLYEDARANAETNYPDQYVSAGAKAVSGKTIPERQGV